MTRVIGRVLAFITTTGIVAIAIFGIWFAVVFLGCFIVWEWGLFASVLGESWLYIMRFGLALGSIVGFFFATSKEGGEFVDDFVGELDKK